jgi:excinuclease ABC subunit C
MPTLITQPKRAGKGAARGTLLAAANGHVAVALRDLVRSEVENRPGVYRMIGPDGDVVYVGKSIQLRSRLLSYFRADRGEKATDIISAAQRIEWDYVPSEFASLLLELRLIQQHRPFFNVQHKIEGAFCFIKITRDEAPRLLMATQVQRDGALYYGPYRSRPLVKNLVREVCDLLQLRDCSPNMPLHFADQIELFGFDPTPGCVRADLHNCLAPCAGRCSRTQYYARVHEARRFLDGDYQRPLRVLYQRMEEAAENLRFEYAARLRDRAARLEGARAVMVDLHGSMDALSFVYSVPGHAGDDRVYLIRRGRIRAELPAPRSSTEEESLLESARRLFGKREFAHTVDPLTVAEILLISRWFRMRPDELDHTIKPAQLLKST